jgi:hypothetical protein
MADSCNHKSPPAQGNFRDIQNRLKPSPEHVTPLKPISSWQFEGVKEKKWENKERLAVFCGKWTLSPGKSSAAQSGTFLVVLPNRKVISLVLGSLLQ